MDTIRFPGIAKAVGAHKYLKRVPRPVGGGYRYIYVMPKTKERYFSAVHRELKSHVHQMIKDIKNERMTTSQASKESDRLKDKAYNMIQGMKVDDQMTRSDAKRARASVDSLLKELGRHIQRGSA